MARARPPARARHASDTGTLALKDAGRLEPLGIDPQSVDGFLSPHEGEALSRWAAYAGMLGPVVEIGSYCGRSTLYLAQGARSVGARVVAVDHHRGSEEHQPGWEWHDPAHWDGEAEALDTLPALRRTLKVGGVEDVVSVLVAPSRAAARLVGGTPGLVFIDGAHTMTAALTDWRVWGARVADGGILAIHDVFPNPADGGRPPHEVHLRAVASGLYDPVERVGSLAVLRRLA